MSLPTPTARPGCLRSDLLQLTPCYGSIVVLQESKHLNHFSFAAAALEHTQPVVFGTRRGTRCEHTLTKTSCDFFSHAIDIISHVPMSVPAGGAGWPHSQAVHSYRCTTARHARLLQRNHGCGVAAGPLPLVPPVTAARSPDRSCRQALSAWCEQCGPAAGPRAHPPRAHQARSCRSCNTRVRV